MAGTGVLPAAVVGAKGVVSHLSTILGHPTGLCVDARIVQRALQIARVRIHTEILVSGGLQCAIPGVGHTAINIRIGRRGMTSPRPLLQVIIHRVFQIVRAHAHLAEFGSHIIAFRTCAVRIVCIRIPVDAKRNTETFAFIDVALRLGIGIVAPAITQTDDRTLHTIGLRLGPVNVILPLGNIDHTLGLLCEEVVLIVEKCLCSVVGSPVCSVFVALEFSEPDSRATLQGRLLRRLFHRLFHSIFHIRGTHRNE